MYMNEDGLAHLWGIITDKMDGLMIWEQVPETASAVFYPAPNSPILVEYFFSCVETPPSGVKSSSNPSVVTGKSSAVILHGEDSVEQPFGFECYGGSYNFTTGQLTVTHVALSPGMSPMDISEHPVDASAPGFIDTWGRTITASQDGTELTISGDADGGTIVYKLATPQVMPLAANPLYAPAHEDRLGDVELDSVSTTAGTVLVMFASPAGRPATNAEIDSICSEELAGVPIMEALDVATKEYVRQQIAQLVNGSPAALDTLKELSDSLGNDPNFATTIATQLGTKVATGSSAYVSGASISGVTLTLTKGDGSTQSVGLMPDAATDAEIDALFEEGD